MAGRANRPVSVTLGSLGERVDARLKSGRYSSVSEVVRDGIRALDREDEMFDALLKAKVEQAMADSRPDLTPEQVSENLRRHHEKRMKGAA